MYKLNLKMGQDLVDSRLKQKIEMDELPQQVHIWTLLRTFLIS